MGCPERRRPDSARPRRSVRAGVVGAALSAGMVLGANGAHAAEPLVVDQSLAIVDAETGQPVAVDPSAMDFKVRKAVLLAMPLQFGEADDAAAHFAELEPIELGTAAEGRTFYSGSDIADAAAPRIAELDLPEDRVDAVSQHFTNLVSIGNGITVRAEEAAEPEPDTPEEQPPPEPTEPPPPPPVSEPPAAEPPASPPDTDPPAESDPEPPALETPTSPERLPKWARSEDGDVPEIEPDTSAPPRAGTLPDTGDLLRQSQPGSEEQDGVDQRADRGDPEAGTPPAGDREQQRSEDVRAAGDAEAVPNESDAGISAPVLIASASLAVVTAGLVRAWVLRRG